MSEKDGVETYDEVEEHQRDKLNICAVPPLAVEGLPGDPAGTVVGFLLVEFEGSEVGGFAREVVIDRWEDEARVDGF